MARQTSASRGTKRLLPAGVIAVAAIAVAALVAATAVAALALLTGCETQMEQAARANREKTEMARQQLEPDEQGKVHLSEEQWRERLTPQQFRVLREAGTEAPFSSEYWDSEARGMYSCVACGQELFRSEGKFTSSCGWPSYFEAAGPDRIEYLPDHSHGMVRTEIRCSRCESHIGHVFEDGPPPTGKRYCVNGIAVKFQPDE